MHNPQRESFTIQVSEDIHQSSSNNSRSPLQKKAVPHFSAMKVFHRFRKILMRFVFSWPSRRPSARSRGCDKPDPPKTSCSSYYSSHSHYNEAIADCIEFFNKSSQDGWFLDGRKSDVMV